MDRGTADQRSFGGSSRPMMTRAGNDMTMQRDEMLRSGA
ncbi:hypothetical protein BZL30_9249 [Mycobacterium kansasii]|uniref:Uncharacterized protein n=1 Tax=Mycobacterium kansasii TaxID=1768 RepID=A0A1V3XD59_MYCKA|nr:hypothetical protein BZL30_9249 [Mycobacterium kansasii]OOK77030.1 hypothetical protein BZL29_3507 [Mycobacterium kansasii]